MGAEPVKKNRQIDGKLVKNTEDKLTVTGSGLSQCGACQALIELESFGLVAFGDGLDQQRALVGVKACKQGRAGLRL